MANKTKILKEMSKSPEAFLDDNGYFYVGFVMSTEQQVILDKFLSCDKCKGITFMRKTYDKR